MKIVRKPCLDCIFPRDKGCNICERYSNYLIKKANADVVIENEVKKDKIIETWCPHCSGYLRIAYD